MEKDFNIHEWQANYLKKETIKEGFDTELRDMLDMADRHAEEAVRGIDKSIIKSDSYPQYIDRYIRAYRRLAEEALTMNQ